MPRTARHIASGICSKQTSYHRRKRMRKK